MPLKTAILCRTNAPLVKCAFDLIRKGRNIKVQIVGRDVAKALKDLVGEILGVRRNCDIKQFEEMLNEWIGEIRQRYAGDESKEAFVAECEDQYECLLAISRQCTDVYGLYEIIDSYFVDSGSVSDDPMTVVLSSGHRSKGLEWDRVIWLRPDLCPHPAAESEADKQQEEHIKYIIATRAKKQLVVCHDLEP